MCTCKHWFSEGHALLLVKGWQILLKYDVNASMESIEKGIYIFNWNVWIASALQKPFAHFYTNKLSHKMNSLHNAHKYWRKISFWTKLIWNNQIEEKIKVWFPSLKTLISSFFYIFLYFLFVVYRTAPIILYMECSLLFVFWWHLRQVVQTQTAGFLIEACPV